MIDKKEKTIKSLGQNFLVDENIVDIFVDNLLISDKDKLLEIGAGKGVLTKNIFDNYNYQNYYVYEIDKRFINILNNFENNSTKILNENILDADLSFVDSSYKIFGALPYYITSPIIHKVLKLKNPPQIMEFIVQKEFAEKIVEETPRANYWTYITYPYEKKIIKIIDQDAFNPAPKVKSAIIKMELNEDKLNKINNITYKKWEGFLHLIYKNPRKMINKTFDKNILDELNIDQNLRPQNLTFNQIETLYNYTHNEQ